MERKMRFIELGKGTIIPCEQYERVKHMQTEIRYEGHGSVLIDDNLEQGTLTVYVSENPIIYQMLKGETKDMDKISVIAHICVNDIVEGEERILYIHSTDMKTKDAELLHDLVERIREFSSYYRFYCIWASTKSATLTPEWLGEQWYRLNFDERTKCGKYILELPRV